MKKQWTGEIKLPRGKTANDRAKEKVIFSRVNPKVVEDLDLDTLDNALTAAQSILKEMLSRYQPAEISRDFAQHIETHLAIELQNIKTHGHRGDDPDFNPDV